MGVARRFIKGQGMRIRDLGTLEGAVLLFGGPYSNLQATRALFDRADAVGVAQNARLCTGDVIGYCADPVATWTEVAQRGGPVLAGNVERQLGMGRGDCGCGFEAGSACDLLAKGWFPFADRHMTPSLRRAMAALPDALTFCHAGRRFALIHGGARDISRFIWPDSAADVFRHEHAELSRHMPAPDVVIGGHAGVAFARDFAGFSWINGGVIGLPPHDGRPHTRFLMLRDGHITIERLAYDHGAASEAMRMAGLNQGYERTLLTGIWPSQDILPSSMRA